MYSAPTCIYKQRDVECPARSEIIIPVHIIRKLITYMHHSTHTLHDVLQVCGLTLIMKALRKATGSRSLYLKLMRDPPISVAVLLANVNCNRLTKWNTLY